jgi:hypothetical protein
MRNSALEQNEHLNLGQVLTTLRALEYPSENVVSTVDIGGFAGAEIFTPAALNQAIQNVLGKEGDKNNRLILFRVGAEGRSFVPNEGENNHYVALHFTQDGPNLKLTYIDPTGAEISPQVREVIASHPLLVGSTIESSRASLQFTNPTTEGVAPYQMRGNDSDCGVLVALSANMVRRNHEGMDQVKLREASSKQLGQTVRQLTNGEKALVDVGQVIDGILRGEVFRGGEVHVQTYNNSPMELDVLERLRAEFDTPEKQQAQVAKLIGEFGSKKLEDTRVTKPHPKPKRPGQTVTEIMPGAKSEILDIMCLAQLLFEGGDKKISQRIRRQISDVLIDQEPKYPQNLEYLQKCLAGFKPAIYKTLKEHFAEKFGVSEEDVQCLPKPTGQQVGAKIAVKDPINPENLRVFYAKSHQEFCSKSDPIYGMQTSNGLGLADLKELFMYKVLEKIGYGPKTEFIVDGNVVQTGVEEGIMIVTQDSGYTKTPAEKEKSFKTFGQIRDEIATTPSEEIADETKRDIVEIDMLSRVFLLEDIMVNDGNFGVVEVSQKGSEETKTKWKIVDFMPPKSQKGKEHLGDKKYAYTNHYGGSTITHGFTSGNFSHTYEEDSPLNKILSDRRTKELWGSAITSLEGGKSERKPGIERAVQESFEEIQQFLDRNKDTLRLTEVDGRFKDLTTRRIQDLAAYRDCTLRNFKELSEGLKRDSSRETGL